MPWFAGVGTATDITSANPTPHFDKKNDSDFIFSYIKNKLTVGRFLTLYKYTKMFPNDYTVTLGGECAEKRIWAKMCSNLSN